MRAIATVDVTAARKNSTLEMRREAWRRELPEWYQLHVRVLLQLVVDDDVADGRAEASLVQGERIPVLVAAVVQAREVLRPKFHDQHCLTGFRDQGWHFSQRFYASRCWSKFQSITVETFTWTT